MASFAQLNAQAASLAEGFYAVMGKDGKTPYFFEIKKVKGSHRIYRLEGAPGDYKRHTLNVAWQTHALAVICKDPIAAFQLYGKHAQWCGVCNSALTNAKSLERGIGPVCWNNLHPKAKPTMNHFQAAIASEWDAA